MGLKYTIPHTVTYYECDKNQQATLPMMISMAILASEAQTNALTDPMELYRQHLGWVITQHDIHIERYPRQNEDIYLTTEAETYNKYFCYRRFLIHDKEGNELMSMLSVFVLMDLNERHIVPVTEEIVGVYQSEKVVRIKRFDPIPRLQQPQSQDYKVRYFDIDGNGHVNNAKYADWFLDVLDESFLDAFEAGDVLIKFDHEVENGQVIASEWEFQSEEDEHPVTVHRISCGDEACASAVIHWRSRDKITI